MSESENGRIVSVYAYPSECFPSPEEVVDEDYEPPTREKSAPILKILGALLALLVAIIIAAVNLTPLTTWVCVAVAVVLILYLMSQER